MPTSTSHSSDAYKHSFITIVPSLANCASYRETTDHLKSDVDGYVCSQNTPYFKLLLNRRWAPNGYVVDICRESNAHLSPTFTVFGKCLVVAAVLLLGRIESVSIT